MSVDNAIFPYSPAKLKELQEAGGITKFDTVTGTEWNQTINGLLLQGGYVSALGAGATVAVLFSAGYVTQVLGIFPSLISATPAPYSISVITLAGFSITNGGAAPVDFYWHAIGV